MGKAQYILKKRQETLRFLQDKLDVAFWRKERTVEIFVSEISIPDEKDLQEAHPGYFYNSFKSKKKSIVDPRTNIEKVNLTFNLRWRYWE